MDAQSLSRLTEVMTAWSRGGKLDSASFAEHFFGRGPDDPVVAKLRGAAQGAATATTHAELRDAGGQLADGMQIVGPDRWPRFLADAQERARDPATVAAVEASQQPPPRSGVDAIRPVYPLEYLLGIGAAGVAGGAAAAARSAGGAILRHVLPERRSPGGDIAPVDAGREASAAKPSNTPSVGKPAEPTSISPGEDKSAPRIKVSPDGRTHILDGDANRKGGGHRSGTGILGKTELPADWSDDKIIEEVESVANDSRSKPNLQKNGRTSIKGTRDGIDIELIVDPDGVNVRTAYPTNTPRNPKAGT